MYLLKSLSFKGGIMVREQSVPCIAQNENENEKDKFDGQ